MKSKMFEQYIEEFGVLVTLIVSVFMTALSAEFLVYPKILESRKDDGSLVIHVHPGLTLTLEKSTILAPKVYFRASLLEDSHAVVLDGEELEKDLYHNSDHMSSLIIQRTGSGIKVQGILNHRQRIAPVGTNFRISDENIPHQIYEIQERSSHQTGDISEDTESSNIMTDDYLTTEQINATQSALGVFLVETCIVASRNYSSYFNTTEELVTYIAAMLNSVALIFAEMGSPAIKFQLNEVMNISDEKLFGNLTCGESENKLTHKPNITVCGFDAEESLNKTRDYVNMCVAAHCDVVYHITGAELTFIQNGTLSTNIVGYAKIGGVCTELKYGIGEDTPHTYLGLATMAHELGHLLGADHDGYSEAENCSNNHGNLMSTLHKGMQNRSKLSACTQEAIGTHHITCSVHKRER
uniref:Reprolysin n=1 Tax=Rhipicephalus zambeziensis TaxID=60191 RepID=A0A224YED3_9ACAR